jgi:hypothetical protein
MKHSKKMVMVPEGEYLTLLNMLKGKDEVGYDKAKIDTDIQQLLKDPKISTLVKGKKYDWFVKQKQFIKKAIEEEASKPQNVIFDNNQFKDIITDISKYLGVAPSTAQPREPAAESSSKASNLSPTQIKRQKRKEKAQRATDQLTLSEEEEDVFKSLASSSKPKKYIIHPNYRDDLIKIIKQNSTKLRVSKDGNLIDTSGQTIKDSHVEDIVDYLTGREKKKPAGAEVLVGRMQDEKYFKDALKWADEHRQRGEGSRSRLRNKKIKKSKQLYKTKGLIRKEPNRFKPLIWAKL